MWRKPSSRRGAAGDDARRDIERRKFLDRLIEADVVATIADDGNGNGETAATAGASNDTPATGQITVDDIAAEWRAFDDNRAALTLSKRMANDYAKRSRQFVVIAGLGAAALASATAVFVWASLKGGPSDAVPVAAPVSVKPAAAPVRPAAPAPTGELAPVSFKIAIDRSQAAEIAFPFELRADDPLGITSFVMIRGVPAGVVVSYAQPLSPSVWVMPASALSAARLAISTLAPRDFAIAVDALSADGHRYAAFELEITARD